MANFCRLCMEVAEDLLPLATRARDNDEIELTKPGLMFEDCLGIEVNEISNLLWICMVCKIQLTYYYDFKKQAIRNHEKLLDVKKLLDKNDDPSTTVIIDNGTLLEDCVSTIIKSEPSESQYEQETVDSEPSKEELLDIEYREDDNRVQEGSDDEGSERDDVAEYDVDIEYLDEDVNQLTFSENDFNDGSIIEELGVGCVKLEECESEVNQHLDDNEDYEEEQGEFNGSEYQLDVYNDHSNDGNIETDDGEGEFSTTRTRAKISNKSKYQCEICGRKFRSMEIYSGHLNVHQGLPAYCCEICTKEFKFKVNYDYHMKNHNNTRSFKCSYCAKTCLSKWDLKVHVRSHLDLRPFACDICGKRFRVRSHMTDHVDTHNLQNTYECPTCLQKYKTKASLKMHKTTVHLKATQYPCKICNKIFYRNQNLKIHQKVHLRSPKNIKIEMNDKREKNEMKLEHY